MTREDLIQNPEYWKEKYEIECEKLGIKPNKVTFSSNTHTKLTPEILYRNGWKLNTQKTHSVLTTKNQIHIDYYWEDNRVIIRPVISSYEWVILNHIEYVEDFLKVLECCKLTELVKDFKY